MSSLQTPIILSLACVTPVDKGDIILVPDPLGFYYGGAYYDPAMIEAYPERYEQLINGDIHRKLKAWAFFSDTGAYDPNAPLYPLFLKLRDSCRIERTEQVDRLSIAYLRESGCP